MAGTMGPMSDTKGERQLALDRLKAKRAFYGGLVAYVIVNAFLWAIWAFGHDRAMPPWPIWVTLGWGMGIAFAAWKTFGQQPITEADIEREVRRGKGSPSD